MTVNRYYEAAFKQKKEALSKKTALRDKKISDLSEKNAEYRKICTSLAECGTEYAKNAFSGDKETLSKLREKMEEFSKRKEEILKEENIGKLEYDCKICEDTGYVGGKVCECIKKAVKQLYITELLKTIPLGENTFKNFDLSFYADEQSKKRMTSVLNLCKEYAEDFGNAPTKNLLFMGNTGLGKTHLTLSIVNEVLEKGYFVFYGSAFNIFAQMEKEHFEKHTNDTFLFAVECDLLCIDDLGSEFVSPYVQTLVYNILNTRLLSGKPTIISTNLNMSEIENRYTERVASRLMGCFVAKNFLGSDIRQLKRLKEK